MSIIYPSIATDNFATKQSNNFSGSQTITGSLVTTGSLLSLNSNTRSNITVNDNSLDIIVTGSNVTGTQVLIDITNNSGDSQFVAQANTYALVQAGSASEGYPYYFQADAKDKFVALEADAASGTIYVGGTGYSSAVNIGTAGSRNISIGNTSGSTAIVIKAGTAGTVITGSVSVSGSQVVTGSVNVSGSQSITGTLSVSGSQSITGSVATSGSQTVTGTLSVSGSQAVTGSVTTSGSQVQFNNTSPSGTIFNAVTALTGASTKVSSFQLNGNEVANISVDGTMVLNSSASTGTGFANPCFRIPINGNTQYNMFQLGGTGSINWEFAIGHYTPSGTPIISSRAGGLFFSSAANTAFSPFTPNQNDLGTTTNTWRSLYAASMITLLTASIRSGRGGTSGETCVQLGSSVADASVNANARLLGVGTGIGGTYIERLYVLKAGTDGFSLKNTSTGGLLTMETSSGTTIGWGGVSQTVYDSNNSITSAPVSVWNRSNAADGASAVAAYSHATAGWTNANAKLHSFRNNLTENAAIAASGRLDQAGTDSTATPGAATINKPIGKSAIAAGSASVTITNSLVTTGSHIIFSPHNSDLTCKELYVIPGAGSFTLSGSAAATATLAFSWRVSGLL